MLPRPRSRLPLPAGTQWKLALEAAGILEPAFQELITWAAHHKLLHPLHDRREC